MKDDMQDGAKLAAVEGAGSIAPESAPHDAKVIDGPWGYACVESDAVFIPAVMATPEYPLRRVLAELFAATGQRRIIFSAILDPDNLRVRLRNIVREWDEWVPYMECHSHCIEIQYETADQPLSEASGSVPSEAQESTSHSSEGQRPQERR